jgi:hypothetical protein
MHVHQIPKPGIDTLLKMAHVNGPSALLDADPNAYVRKKDLWSVKDAYADFEELRVLSVSLESA